VITFNLNHISPITHQMAELAKLKMAQREIDNYKGVGSFLPRSEHSRHKISFGLEVLKLREK